MSLSVQLISDVEQISPADVDRWNELAANPFQRWEWLGSWWLHYKGNHQLYVLTVKRDGETIAFAPWFLERRLTTGKTIQFLGSGKACTDHLSLLVRSNEVDDVCEAVADWLYASQSADARASNSHVWDAIELIGVDADDAAINGLCHRLGRRGLDVRQSPGDPCYVIDLPDTWDDYVQMRSKSGRREIRQSLKNIDNGTIVVNTVKDHLELDCVWDEFVSAHQSRRHASGTTGCFDHPPFGEFLRTAASELLKSGLLHLVVASVEGNVVAVQFAVADDHTWYFYQSGMQPNAAQLRPGLSVFCHAIRATIGSGRSQFDMMRGDEPYKQRWRADRNDTQEIRVCSDRTTARVRHRALDAGLALKNLVKSVAVNH